MSHTYLTSHNCTLRSSKSHQTSILYRARYMHACPTLSGGWLVGGWWYHQPFAVVVSSPFAVDPTIFPSSFCRRRRFATVFHRFPPFAVVVSFFRHIQQNRIKLNSI